MVTDFVVVFTKHHVNLFPTMIDVEDDLDKMIDLLLSDVVEFISLGRGSGGDVC